MHVTEGGYSLMERERERESETADTNPARTKSMRNKSGQ